MNKITNNERGQLRLRLLIKIVLFIAFILVLIYIVPPLFSLLSPFILAFIVASILNPPVSKLQKKLGASRRLLSFIAVILVLFGLVALIVLFINPIIKETVLLAKNIQVVSDYIRSSLESLTQNLKWILDMLPGNTEIMLSNITDSMIRWLQSASKEFANYVLLNTVTISARVGGGILTTVVFIMATYFITADYPRLSTMAERFKDTHIHSHFHVVKNVFKSAIGGYFKAQLILALLAFIVMFVALALYGQQYVFLTALILAIVDFLPLIGTSAILIPWGILCFVNGDVEKAIFLLVLAAAFFVLRKMVEPKIISHHMSLHPLLALISVYLGMKLAGVWGAILGPIIAMIIIGVIKSGVFDSTIKGCQEHFRQLR